MDAACLCPALEPLRQACSVATLPRSMAATRFPQNRGVLPWLRPDLRAGQIVAQHLLLIEGIGELGKVGSAEACDDGGGLEAASFGT
jgi:hypothetical protein